MANVADRPTHRDFVTTFCLLWTSYFRRQKIGEVERTSGQNLNVEEILTTDALSGVGTNQRVKRPSFRYRDLRDSIKRSPRTLVPEGITIVTNFDGR